MNKAALFVLHNYTDFANDLLFTAAAQLPPAALTCQSSPSHGSVIGLMQHMLGTEIYFLFMCEGKPLPAPSAEMPSLEMLREFYRQVSTERESYLQKVSAAELEEAIAVNVGAGVVRLPRWQFIAQSLLGSVHHRGELSIVMTGLGQPLPTMDAILQFVDQSGQVWPVG